MSISFKILWGILALVLIVFVMMFSFGGVPAPKAEMKKDYTLEQLKQKYQAQIPSTSKES